MTDGPTHDPDLLDLLDAVPARRFDAIVWRVFWAGADALAGGTHGGRWSPSGFEVLYTSLTEDAAISEIYYHLSRAPVRSSSHKRIAQIQAACRRVVRFDSLDDLAPLGVDADRFLRGDDGLGDMDRTREIGAAARFLDIQGMIVPSARSMGLNLVIFPDRLEARDSLSISQTFDVNWPAWRERVRSIPGRTR